MSRLSVGNDRLEAPPKYMTTSQVYLPPLERKIKMGQVPQ
jgi:hypothetical protein